MMKDVERAAGAVPVSSLRSGQSSDLGGEVKESTREAPRARNPPSVPCLRHGVAPMVPACCGQEHASRSRPPSSVFGISEQGAGAVAALRLNLR